MGGVEGLYGIQKFVVAFLMIIFFAPKVGNFKKARFWNWGTETIWHNLATAQFFSFFLKNHSTLLYIQYVYLAT